MHFSWPESSSPRSWRSTTGGTMTRMSSLPPGTLLWSQWVKPCQSHFARGQWPPTDCSAHTLSSPRVSLLQPSCHVQPSTRACGWREVRLWLAVSLSQMELPPVLRETLLVTASGSPDLPKPEHWSTLTFQILGTESPMEVSATGHHCICSGPFTLQTALKLFPANSSQKLALTCVL